MKERIKDKRRNGRRKKEGNEGKNKMTKEERETWQLTSKLS